MTTVLFVQLPAPRFLFQAPPTNIHLAAGFVSAALDASGIKDVEVRVIEPQVVNVFADEGLINSVVAMRPTVLAMTLYVWNVQRSLFIAAGIKQRLPDTIILLGGPEVTPDNSWVMAHPAADVGIFGEGESRIGPIIEALIVSGSRRGIPGSFFKEDGRLRVDPTNPLPWDLAAASYPYLDGKIGPSKDGTIFLETVRGCPYKCRYCYYHKAFKGVRRHPAETVEKVLDLAYDNNSTVREIYLMDPTFNATKNFRELLASMTRRRNQKDVALHAEIRADLLDREDVDLLKGAGLTSAEVGLQTVNPASLRRAGRAEDSGKLSEGVLLLKQAGIEVTTGIILGLPEDTPEGFRNTLGWLKQTGSYSVVHPFVLSVLPGTYFRAHASTLGLKYDPRPPYYVRFTKTFPENEFRSALLECESVFDMELDHISVPSLVDRGPGVITSPDYSQYISKWIVDAGLQGFPKSLSQVIAKATDPFTFWFRGHAASQAQEGIFSILREFGKSNPHTCVNVVMEYPKPPSTTFLQKAIDAIANPSLFLNRSYQPLYLEDEVVLPTLTLLLPDTGNRRAREAMRNEYDSLATIVWDLGEADETAALWFDPPALISWATGDTRPGVKTLWKALSKHNGDTEEALYFRDPALQAAWNQLHGSFDPSAMMSEKILVGI